MFTFSSKALNYLERSSKVERETQGARKRVRKMGIKFYPFIYLIQCLNWSPLNVRKPSSTDVSVEGIKLKKGSKKNNSNNIPSKMGINLKCKREIAVFGAGWHNTTEPTEKK